MISWDHNIVVVCLFVCFNWNVKSLYLMFLTLIQYPCFKSKIAHFYWNIVKGFIFPHWYNIQTNFKVRASFVHQSYHNLKNLILNTEKNRYTTSKFPCKYSFSTTRVYVNRKTRIKRAKNRMQLRITKIVRVKKSRVCT